MDKVEKSCKESARAVWETPKLSRLNVDQTLNGAAYTPDETFYGDGRPYGGPSGG